MPTDDDLRTRLRRLADAHEPAELRVDDIVAAQASRARRRRLLAVAAVFLLVLGAAGMVQVLSDGDEGDTDVASGAEDDDPVTTTAPPAPEDEATDPAEAVTTTTVVDAYAGSPLSSYSPGGGGGWVVPWGEGFLAAEQIFEPSDVTMADLVPDIAERLPAEVIEALGDVTDIDEATALLDQVGLLDEATTAVMEDPVLYNAYSRVMSGGTWHDQVSISEDGTTWTVLDGFAPPGDVQSGSAASDGERLVLVEQRWNEGEPTEITVHVTTDLENWTSTPIEVPDAGFPAHVREERYAGPVTLGPDGWLLTVTTSGWIDLYELMPDDLHARFEMSGWSPEPDGLRIFDATPYMEGPATTVPATTTIPATTTTTFVESEGTLIPWSELGITYDEYVRFSSGVNERTTAFLGAWDGTVTPVAMPQDHACCTVVHTGAGYVAASWPVWTETGETPPRMWFSTDARTWNEIDGPPGSSSYGSMTAVAGGVLLFDESGGLWRAGADGTGWTSVEIPGPPGDSTFWFQSSGGPGVATVVDVTDYGMGYEPVAYETEFEHDGFRIHTATAEDGTVATVVEDLATGEVVLDDSYDSWSGAMPDFVDFDGDALNLLDEAGDLIVSVPYDVFADHQMAAEQAARAASGWEEPTGPFTADFWLVATLDGLDWTVVDLVDEDDGGYALAAVSADAAGGPAAVVQEWQGGWQHFPLE